MAPKRSTTPIPGSAANYQQAVCGRCGDVGNQRVGLPGLFQREQSRRDSEEFVRPELADGLDGTVTLVSVGALEGSVG